jgi:NAD(P)-dependent dehydrogenase (short-subunit alcohol dehydrogenase family)
MTDIASERTGRLVGQVAIVTGGSSGIGRATCLALAREGAHVVVVGRNQFRVNEVVTDIELGAGSGKTLGLLLDVRREADMSEMVSQTLARFGCIDILVANAGILRGKQRLPKLLVQLPSEEWNEILDTNLKGVFLSNRAVLSTMIRQHRGQIVNISSGSGRRGRAYDAAYCASKFGVIGLSEALAEEVHQYNIRVQVLSPGAVNTPILEQNGPIPRPRQILAPERVADFIIYLVTQPVDSVLLRPTIEPSLLLPATFGEEKTCTPKLTR